MHGIHVQSTDSTERARLEAAVRASGWPASDATDAAELVLMGAKGISDADCVQHALKYPHVPFALSGATISDALLDAASRSGVIAFLPDPGSNPGRHFVTALRRALEVARELTHLRQWAIDVELTPACGSADPLAADGATPEFSSQSREQDPGRPGHAERSDSSELERRLREAAANQDFELFYQPKVNADTRRVVGFEALIRWTDAELGSVSPADFIPVAEELGLIEAIGEWCIREACSQSIKWIALGLDPGRVAVNVSPVQFQCADFGRWLIDTVTRSGLDLDQFEIEITEGCLLEDQQAIATLRLLSEAGIHVAVDDFGTGYSSLQYLRNLPIQCLKIDRVFVTDLEFDSSARSLAAAIISLAWNLGFHVVAEGVESEYQWRFLADHGCDEIQGFHFSRPLSVADAADLLEREKVRRIQD